MFLISFAIKQRFPNDSDWLALTSSFHTGLTSIYDAKCTLTAIIITKSKAIGQAYGDPKEP